ncbi:MAG: acyl-CoA thioesterase [Gammaproteobacteria bacterium]
MPTAGDGHATSRGRRKSLVSASVEIEVAFPDLDPMAIAWHGHYLRYFESARVALMRRIGYDYPDMQASGYTWPIIEAKLRYVRAARYAQRLRVTAGLETWETCLHIGYMITDANNGERLTTGYTRQCAVDADGELQLCTPEALLQCLKKFL